MSSNFAALDSLNSKTNAHISDSGAANAGVLPSDAANHQERLEKRLQAQLRDGTRSKNVKRLEDPIAKHLLRVAGNPAYRNLRQSVIVTGKTLVCELLSNFQCKRLALRRRCLAALQASLPPLRNFVDPLARAQNSATPSGMPSSSIKDPGHSRVHPLLNANVETHFVSNRILRKVAGFHSYDDGCVAEMRMPEAAENLGNMRLLLCLGNIPPSLGQTGIDQTPTRCNSSADFLEPGTVGTLLRTAAALQWQGAWILPSCPDIFNPLAIRASQGALFWLPYRRGTVKELIELCKAKDLAICVPHEGGIPVRTAGIFEKRKKRGVCLVLDTSLISAAERYHHASKASQFGASRVEGSEDASSMSNEPRRGRLAQAEKSSFKPDVFLSLGSDVAPNGSMPLLHPITTASLLLYHVKHSHFPSLAGSPHLFSVKQKR